MKLKRIISALVVFTLVMTCAVCSVSAAASYKASTSYKFDENGKPGDVTITAAVVSATAGEMVSYILYGDGETTPTKVTEDNIVHIDQANVNAKGDFNFDVVTLPKDQVLNRTFKFTSSTTGAVSPWGAGTSIYMRRDAVTTIDDRTLGINFISQSVINGQDIYICYVDKDGNVSTRENISGNISSSGLTDFNGPTAIADPDKVEGLTVTVPLDAQSVAIQFNNKNDTRKVGRYIQFRKLSGSFFGDKGSSPSTSADYVYDDRDSDNVVSKLAGNVYKETISDGNFYGFPLEGGCVFTIIGAESGTTTTTGMMKVDRLPIITTVKNDKGIDCDSVTFLVSYTAANDGYTGGGVYVYRYPRAAADITVAGNSAGAGDGEPVGQFADYASEEGSGQFAIQLVDEAGSGYLDPDKYYFVAKPYYIDAEGKEHKLDLFSEKYYTQAGKKASGEFVPTSVEE